MSLASSPSLPSSLPHLSLVAQLFRPGPCSASYWYSPSLPLYESILLSDVAVSLKHKPGTICHCLLQFQSLALRVLHGDATSLPFQHSPHYPHLHLRLPMLFPVPGWRTLLPPPTLLPLSSILYLLSEPLLKICYSLRPGSNLVPLKNPFKILWNSLSRHCVCKSSVSGLALICLPSVRVIYKCLFLLLCCTF